MPNGVHLESRCIKMSGMTTRQQGLECRKYKSIHKRGNVMLLYCEIVFNKTSIL